MSDMEARRIIEALRSGVPSKAVGQYFSEARPQILQDIKSSLDRVVETKRSAGTAISGKYGEGKTHLLNTVFNLAQQKNMVVSTLSLGKESPMSQLYVIYQKLMQNTYLPGRIQPGLLQLFEQLSPNNSTLTDLAMYAGKELATDKLYYVLRSYVNTEEQDERFALQADMEGDFISNVQLRQIYKRIFNEKVKFNVNFSKTKHCGDYFQFMSQLFQKLGYNGWVILFDETELIGRLGKKTRLKAYQNMEYFLFPGQELKSVYTMFALSASYEEDVIEGKQEYQNLEELAPEQKEAAKKTLDALCGAVQLRPLTRDEIFHVIGKIREFHEQAYEWDSGVSTEYLQKTVQPVGYLLRTKIRAVIELLDQMYQYGEAGTAQAGELGKQSYEEDAVRIEDMRL